MLDDRKAARADSHQVEPLPLPVSRAQHERQLGLHDYERDEVDRGASTKNLQLLFIGHTCGSFAEAEPQDTEWNALALAVPTPC